MSHLSQPSCGCLLQLSLHAAKIKATQDPPVRNLIIRSHKRAIEVYEPTVQQATPPPESTTTTTTTTTTTDRLIFVLDFVPVLASRQCGSKTAEGLHAPDPHQMQ